MKKTGIMNSRISKIVSELGHTDSIVICDSGLPIPPHVERIDIALKKGVPSFLETLATVLEEMQVESAVVAEEMTKANAQLRQQLAPVMEGIPIRAVTHEEFKRITHQAKAVIRTGECTPYANIILKAGVIF
ncbi:D-ribose pyranase [Paenibacillus filicis]|uniref:D-ribose pyranase n=1 Tax=Paenibacillus gyeongsangnamensis TaxID=3388067 RepID=A0ABT4Q286_9BACL|nr:D-ribose pyranase [Paenibacillus filicis]MCZ8510921.1 D-ribose pyranase [Paenibacillus filicis]